MKISAHPKKPLSIAMWDYEANAFAQHIANQPLHRTISTKNGGKVNLVGTAKFLTPSAPLLYGVKLEGEQVKGVFDKAGSQVALAVPCTQKGNQQVLGRFDRGHHLVFGAINIDTAQVLLVVHPVTAMLLHQTTGIACVASVFGLDPFPRTV